MFKFIRKLFRKKHKFTGTRFTKRRVVCPSKGDAYLLYYNRNLDLWFTYAELSDYYTAAQLTKYTVLSPSEDTETSDDAAWFKHGWQDNHEVTDPALRSEGYTHDVSPTRRFNRDQYHSSHDNSSNVGISDSGSYSSSSDSSSSSCSGGGFSGGGCD